MTSRKPVTYRIHTEEAAKLNVSARFHGRSAEREAELALRIHNTKTFLTMLDGSPNAAAREADARRELAVLEEQAFGVKGIEQLILSFERAGLGEPVSN